MAGFTVTAAELRKKAAELRDLNSQFKSEVGSMEGYEEALNGMWDGEANDAFHRAFMNDKGQMDNFYNLIEQYAAALETIAQKYEEAEKIALEKAQTRTY